MRQACGIARELHGVMRENGADLQFDDGVLAFSMPELSMVIPKGKPLTQATVLYSLSNGV